MDLHYSEENIKQYAKKIQNTPQLYTHLMKKNDAAQPCATYLNSLGKDNTWEELTTMDRSHMMAVRSAVTKDLTLIHGRLGTRKTHVAVNIINLLLKNRIQMCRQSDTPVLVLFYTNRGLDHLLEQLLTVTSSLVSTI